MSESQQLSSGNINTLWLNNIFENFKNLEMLERLAREGCTSLMDYLQIPYEQRKIVIGDTQYKNLRLIVTELNLLITDLTPLIGETKAKEFRKMLEAPERVIDKEQLFITVQYSAKTNSITAIKTTEFFKETLRYLNELRVTLISDREISSVLYVKENSSEHFRRGY